MAIKWIGSVLIIGGCGGFGFSIASAYRRQDRMLRHLLRLLRLMEWELRYRLTALPELCLMMIKESDGLLKKVFQDLHRELSWQREPECAACMGTVLRRNPDIPPKVRRSLRHLGSILGRFDMEGQLQGLQSVQEEVQHYIEDGSKDREQRVRSYQTLGLCAGLALAILLV